MANSPRNSLGNVRSDMDIAYPEHLSRLHRHSVLADYPKPFYNPKKNKGNRRGNRYRTQPVTFGEIQEVDEESMVLDGQNSEDQSHPISASISTSKLDLDFYRFSRVFEAKMKKQVAAVDPEVNSDMNMEQSNGNQPSSNEGQRRWTDYTREGSV